MRNPLLDLDFLKQLDEYRNKELYAKINLLTFDENPIAEIQGAITQGSINIDGNSSVRRTCSLTLITNNPNVNETDWVLKNKFSLEVGVKNEINSNYPEIIWFKQGLYVFTSISMSVQTNNYTINLQGKDKMCLLNGELGGAITASTDFGTIEEYETLGSGEIIRNIVDLPIIDIVKNAVHLYAGQPLENIILNDIDEYGKELIEYRGDKPLWMLRNIDGTITNMIIDDTKSYYIAEKTRVVNLSDGSTKIERIYIDNNREQISIENFKKNNGNDYFWNLADINNTNINAWVFSKNKNKIENEINYYLVEINQYDTCGYRLTELTYPGELKANVGESIVSILDKIKNMFSDFEYFFDLDGRFVFQKKKTYINTSWNNLEISKDQMYAADAAYTNSVAYSFENGQLLSAFNNQPQIGNIKNDFSIWGKRTGTNGVEIPIHMRYAINIKPQYYKPTRWQRDLDGNLIKQDGLYIKEDLPPYVTSEWRLEHPDLEPAAAVVDWREIIYQMANDFYAFNYRIENFKEEIANNNPNYYPIGKTGYENYYIDLQSFWRDLYNPYIDEDCQKLIDKAEKEKDNNNMSQTEYNTRSEEIEKERTELKKQYGYIDKDGNIIENHDFWNINVEEYPENLNFWFDFMDIQEIDDSLTYSIMSKYSIPNIGCRPKPINDDKVKAIYYKETPDVLFLTQEDYTDLISNFESYTDMTGSTFIRLTPQMENYFTISAQGKSAQNELDNLLYQHTYANESVTLTAIPIYYLQPNVRIFVKDDNTKINGEYIVTKITVPLQYNGTTSITATKAVERIY